MSEIEVVATRLSDEAAARFSGLRPGEIPKDIAIDKEYGVYHIFPPRDEVPDHVMDSVFRLIADLPARFSIKYES